MTISQLNPQDALRAHYIDELASSADELSTATQTRALALAAVPPHARYSAKLQMRRNVIWALGQEEGEFAEEIAEIVLDPRAQENLKKTWDNLQKKRKK